MQIAMHLISTLFALLELALFLRFLLPLFGVAPNHRFYRFLVLVTDPIVAPLRQWLGNPPMLILRGLRVDAAVIVAFFGLMLLNALIQGLLGLASAMLMLAAQPGLGFGILIWRLIDFAFQLYFIILLARVLMDLVRMPPTSPVVRFLWDATEPLLQPIRQQLRPFVGPFDLSPLILYLLLYFLLILMHALLFPLLG